MKSFACQRNAAQGSKRRNQEKKILIREKSRALKIFTKQSVEIEALRNELNVMKEKDKEQNLTAEVAALLNTSKTNKSSSNNENMSVARQVMAIVERGKRDK